MTADLLIRPADLTVDSDQQAILALMEAMSLDAPGSQRPLAASTRKNLIAGLQAMPTTLVMLALQKESVLGGAVCFWGFSTFAAQRLLNIHDLIVLAEHRGQGVGRQLLAAVENHVREQGGCKVTLEVDEQNAVARRLYADLGYIGDLEPGSAGRTFFLGKKLDA